MDHETAFITFLLLAPLLIVILSVAVTFVDCNSDDDSDDGDALCMKSCSCCVVCVFFTVYGGLLFAIVWSSAVMDEVDMSPPLEHKDMGTGLYGVGFAVVLISALFFAAMFLVVSGVLYLINSHSLSLIIFAVMMLIIPGLFTMSLGNNRLMAAEEYSEMTMLTTPFTVEYHENIVSPEYSESHGYVGKRLVNWGHAWACPQEPSTWCNDVMLIEHDCIVATHKISDPGNGKKSQIKVRQVRDNAEAKAMAIDCLKSKTLSGVSPETGEIVDMVVAYGNCPRNPGDCKAQTWIPDEMGRNMVLTGKVMAISGAALTGAAVLFYTFVALRHRKMAIEEEEGEDTMSPPAGQDIINEESRTTTSTHTDVYTEVYTAGDTKSSTTKCEGTDDHEYSDSSTTLGSTCMEI